MRRRLAAIVLTGLLTIASVFTYANLVKAAGATLYLSPASGSVQAGSNISVGVRVNTGGETVNAVQANLSYPTDKFDFVSTTLSSDFQFNVENVGGSGSIRIGSGSLSGVTGDKLVGTVTFTAKGSGAGAVNFASGSAVTRSSDSTDILSGTTGGTYTVTTPPPPSTPSTPSGTGSSSSSSSSSGSSSSNKSSSSSAKSGTTTKTSPAATSTPTAAVAGDNTAPAISSVSVTDLGYKAATITWTTSEPANSTVMYGPTQAYGLNAVDGNYTTSHKVVLPPDALIAGTKFNFLVKSADPAGNTTTSDNNTFTTKGMILDLKVLNQSNKAVKGAQVTYGDISAKTDKNGHAILNGLPTGKLAIKIKAGGKTSTVTVEVNDTDNGNTQTASVKIDAGNGIPIVVPAIIVVLLVGAGVAFWFFRMRGDGPMTGSGTPTVGPEGPMIVPQSASKTPEAGSNVTPTDKNPPPTVITPQPPGSTPAA
jgi:hypothetical protein